ncbi:MAG: hypothetical protein ABFC80_05495 [Coriobacteriales bacterium]
MYVAFILTMPGVNTWNGRWSGDGKLFAVVKNLGRSKAACDKAVALVGHHGYAWDDGWRADIEVRVVDSAEARRIRSKSRGFLGYSWMIDNLLDHGTTQ